MDGLGIENAISQANAITSQAENARAERSDRIRAVGIQNQKDKNAATNQITSDRNTFLAMDSLGLGEGAYKIGTSGLETLADYRASEGKVDFLGRQLKRSLGADIGRGIDNVANNWITGKVNTLFGQAAPSRRLNVQPAGQAGGPPAAPEEATPFGRRLPGGVPEAPTGAGEFNSIGEGAEPIPDRTARLNRIFIQESQPSPAERAGLNTTSPARDSDSTIRTQLTGDVQETAAQNARGLSDAPLGNQLSHDTNNFGRVEAQQGLTQNNLESVVPEAAPTTTLPTPPAGTPGATPAGGTPLTETDKTIADLKGKFGKVQAIASNPLVKSGMKVVGNIEGGEDIYDLFEKRNDFTDKGQAGGGWHEGAHILSSLGTVADIAGIFLPGAEELGAALNMTGGILNSVGDHEKDIANASTVFTNASNSAAAAAKPISIPEGLQTAGLIAGSATHLGTTGMGVSTF